MSGERSAASSDEREAELRSKVGDWIWLQLHQGRRHHEITDDLIRYTEELVTRWTSGERFPR